MSAIVRPTKPRAPLPRRLHLLMRDGSAVEGIVKVGAGQSIVAYLNSRSGWMSMTQAHRVKSDDVAGHLLVQTDHIVMASAPDGNVQVVTTPAVGVDDRIVEFVMLGGRTIRGYVPAAAGQRLSDCVAASGRFMGVSLARLFPEEQDVGDIALATGALALVRDLRGAPPPDQDG